MLRMGKVISGCCVCCLLWGSVAFGKELKIAVGNFAPYFMQQNESGIALDLVKEAFKLLPQYTLKFEFMSNDRLVKALNAGTVDAAVNVFPGADLKGHLSAPFLRYTDVAVTLKKKNLVINRIADLQGKSIAAYQGAKDLIGEEFKKMAAANPEYQEYPEPIQTTRMLVLERKDVRFGDLHIFLDDLQTEYNGKITPEAFTIHSIMPDVYSLVGFTDSTLRDEFNRAVEQIKTNGTYDSVYEEYEKAMGFSKK